MSTLLCRGHRGRLDVLFALFNVFFRWPALIGSAFSSDRPERHDAARAAGINRTPQPQSATTGSRRSNRIYRMPPQQP